MELYIMSCIILCGPILYHCLRPKQYFCYVHYVTIFKSIYSISINCKVTWYNKLYIIVFITKYQISVLTNVISMLKYSTSYSYLALQMTFLLGNHSLFVGYHFIWYPLHTFYSVINCRSHDGFTDYSAIILVNKPDSKSYFVINCRSHDGFTEDSAGNLLVDKAGSKYASQRRVFEDLGQGVLDNAFEGKN